MILFPGIKEVISTPGKEPHLYQIHIICQDYLWKLSLEKDKEAADAWFCSLKAVLDPKCFNVPRLSPVEIEDDTHIAPRRRQSDVITRTSFLRKEFSLDGYEYVMFDFKCSIILFSNPYSTMSGVLYVTENFLCFMGTKCKKLKIPINEITALNYESSHQHFDIIISTTSEKYQISFKNSPKDLDQIIIIFYLWYHTPTYFANDDINKAIAIYEKERIKKEELKEKEKRTDVKKQQRNRLLKEIGLNDSTKGSRGNLNISKRARDLNESSPSYIVISTQPLNPKTKYAKQFIIESEALYLIKDTYLPVFIVLDENHFSLKINPNFPYQESLWSLKKILKKDSVINTLFSYDNVSIITVESEYEHILIEFRGSEVTIRLCTAYIQLLLNQFYLKNKQFDIKWGTAITPFAYEHPVITKLFFLLKKPEFLTSDTSSSAKDT